MSDKCPPELEIELETELDDVSSLLVFEFSKLFGTMSPGCPTEYRVRERDRDRER